MIHATPGEMKSFRSSAERIALIVVGTPLCDESRILITPQKGCEVRFPRVDGGISRNIYGCFERDKMERDRSKYDV